MQSGSAPIADVRALLAGIGARLPPEPLPGQSGGGHRQPEKVAAAPRALAASVDLTLLRPEATAQQIRALCDAAAAHGCFSVCVNPMWVELAVSCAAGRTAVCSVASFPLGATTTAAKLAEASLAISAGAAEVDMVSAVGWLVEGLPRDGGPPVPARLLDFQEQVARVMQAVRAADGPVPAEQRALKVILETCLLDDRQKVAGALLVAGARANFVKTSTGFSTGGASVADVALLHAALGGSAHAHGSASSASSARTAIKASGGIRDAAAARALLEAGATRLGCSSIAVFAAH